LKAICRLVIGVTGFEFSRPDVILTGHLGGMLWGANISPSVFHKGNNSR
jgi:hypothetical protein